MMYFDQNIVLLIGGPKNGETLAVDPSYVAKQFPLEFKEADYGEFFKETLTQFVPVKTNYYKYTDFVLKDERVYAVDGMHTAMVKYELIQHQMQSFSYKDQIDLFGLTYEEREYIEKTLNFEIKIATPAKQKFIPGENCLFA